MAVHQTSSAMWEKSKKVLIPCSLLLLVLLLVVSFLLCVAILLLWILFQIFFITWSATYLFNAVCPLVCMRYENPAVISASYNMLMHDRNESDALRSFLRVSEKTVAWYISFRIDENFPAEQIIPKPICSNRSNDMDRLGKDIMPGDDQKRPTVKTFPFENAPIATQETDYRAFRPATSLSPEMFYYQALSRTRQPEDYPDVIKRYEPEIPVFYPALPRWAHHDQPDNTQTEKRRSDKYQQEEMAPNQALPKRPHHDFTSMNVKKRHEEYLDANNKLRLERLMKSIYSHQDKKHAKDEIRSSVMSESEGGRLEDKTTKQPSGLVWNYPLQNEHNSRTIKVSRDQEMGKITNGLETLQKKSQKESLKEDSTPTRSESRLHQRHHKRRNNPHVTDVTDFVSASNGNTTEATSSLTSTSSKEKMDPLYLCAIILVIVLVIGSMLLGVIYCLMYGRKNKRSSERLPLLANENPN